MPFTYDVFLSYASADEAWAIRFADDLKAKGLRVFRDKERLRPGFEWKKELEEALEASEHFVVLWTPRAKDSPWVSREISEFRARADAAAVLGALRAGRNEAEARLEAPRQRRQVFVNLAAADHAYRDIQGVDDLLGSDTYTAGVGAQTDPLHGEAWHRAVKRVAAAIQDSDTRTPVRVSVVAMVEAECDELNLAQRRGGPRSLEDALGALGIATVEELRERYGPRRRDWKPFGGADRVEFILDRVLDLINLRLKEYYLKRGQSEGEAGQHGYRWDYVEFIDPALSNADVSAAAQRLSAGPALVVIDPLSMYADNVFNRFAWLSSCLENPEAVVAVLGPCGATPLFTELRELVRALTTPHLLPYFEPPLETRLLARCGPLLQDEPDLTRLIASSISRPAARPRTAGRSYTRMGGKSARGGGPA